MSDNKKYAVYPGFVYSKNDRDLHFISARNLMHLYRVDPNECIVINELKSFSFGQVMEQRERDRLIALAAELKLISLRPSASGNYVIPQQQ